MGGVRSEMDHQNSRKESAEDYKGPLMTKTRTIAQNDQSVLSDAFMPSEGVKALARRPAP